MRLTQNLSPNVNRIQSYSATEIIINDQKIKNAVIIDAHRLQIEPALRDVGDLEAAHITYVLTLNPELVILGSGIQQIFPTSQWSAQFLKAGVGFEVMNTGAACRTFNVLMAESRRVVAILIP